MASIGVFEMRVGRGFWRSATEAGRYVNITCQRQTIGFQNRGRKCERIKGRELPSETVQECLRSHLAKELEHIGKSVPLIAVGNRAFNAVRQSFPDRFVLNGPSPNGEQARALSVFIIEREKRGG